MEVGNQSVDPIRFLSVFLPYRERATLFLHKEGIIGDDDEFRPTHNIVA